MFDVSLPLRVIFSIFFVKNSGNCKKIFTQTPNGLEFTETYLMSH